MKLQITRADGRSYPLSDPAVLIGTWFGAGLLPLTPGTWGSLAALPFAWIVHWLFGWLGLAVATVAIAALGAWASERLITLAGRKDPGQAVVDEVAGMFLTLLLVPRTWWAYAIGFVLFRIADIVKPFPADWCDKNLNGGVGVMADDLAAALWSMLAAWALCAFLPWERWLAALGL
jgi:phosphatidylglycerophosphatase A